MKNILSILTLLILGACAAYGQNNSNIETEESIVITISGQANNSNSCSRKCIRISNVKVQFDNCYDQDSEVFKSDCEEELNRKELYSTLLNTKISYWEEIENEIDENSTIDAGLPFIITITKNGEARSFILLGIDEFPTKEYGEFIGQLESLFDNWKDCTHNSK